MATGRSFTGLNDILEQNALIMMRELGIEPADQWSAQAQPHTRSEFYHEGAFNQPNRGSVGISHATNSDPMESFTGLRLVPDYNLVSGDYKGQPLQQGNCGFNTDYCLNYPFGGNNVNVPQYFGGFGTGTDVASLGLITATSTPPPSDYNRNMMPIPRNELPERNHGFNSESFINDAFGGNGSVPHNFGGSGDDAWSLVSFAASTSPPPAANNSFNGQPKRQGNCGFNAEYCLNYPFGGNNASVPHYFGGFGADARSLAIMDSTAPPPSDYNLFNGQPRPRNEVPERNHGFNSESFINGAFGGQASIPHYVGTNDDAGSASTTPPYAYNPFDRRHYQNNPVRQNNSNSEIRSFAEKFDVGTSRLRNSARNRSQKYHSDFNDGDVFVTRNLSGEKVARLHYNKESGPQSWQKMPVNRN